MNTPENLDIIQQVTKAIQEQTASLNALTEALGKNASVSQSISDSSKQQTQAQNQNKDAIQGVTDAMREQEDGVSGLAGALGRNNAAMSKLSEQHKKNNKNLKLAVAAFGALNLAATAGIEAFNGMRMAGGLMVDGLTAGFGMLQAGIGLLMSPFEGLMKVAAAYNNEMAEKSWAANQNLIKQFGDLNGVTGQFVKSMKKDLYGATNNLAAANNSLWAAIGDGPDILQEVTKMAGEFGDKFIRLKGQIKGAADEMFLMGRGMNISGESMKMMATNAEAAGGSLEESLQEGMVASAHLANQFGLDVKDIGKNMDKMMKNMADFGHLSQKELAATAAYSAKLGVSIESLQKVMGSFDTFESAAQNAGKLAEAFGMNVDVMGMMNAETQAEQMDMLRKSFEATGKSVNDLSRHELKLLGESMGGIPIDELKNSLSMSSDEMGFGDFSDAAEEAAQKLTPEEAMSKVAKSIEKLNKVLTKLEGGPLTDFIKGIKEGFMNSKEFKAILGDIGDWLREFSNAGKEIGAMFSSIFLKDGSKMQEIIYNIFNVEKVRAFLADIKSAFKGLFDGLAGLTSESDPTVLAEQFLDKIMAAFEKWTSGSGSFGLVDGLKKMLEIGLKMLAGMAPKIIKSAAKYITEFAKSFKQFLESDDKVGNTVGEGLVGAFSLAFTSIKDALINELGPALLDLFGVLLKKFGPPIALLLGAVFTVIFVKAIVTAALAAIAGAAVKLAIDGLAGKLKEMLGNSGNVDPNEVENAPRIGEVVEAAGKAFGKMVDSFKQLSRGDVLKAAGVLLVMAGTLAISLVMFGAAIKLIAQMFKPVKMVDVMKALFVTTAAVIQSAIFIGALKFLKPKPNMAVNMLVLALILGVGGLALGIALHAMQLAWSGLDEEKVTKSMAALTLISLMAIPFTLAALAFSLVANGPALIAIGLGLLGLSAVLVGAAVLAIPATVFGEAFASVDEVSVIKGAVILGGIIGGIVAFMAGMLSMASYLLLIPTVLLGITIFLTFLTGLATATPFIVDQLNYFGDEMNKLNVGKVMFGVGALAGIFLLTNGLVLAGVYLAALAPAMVIAALGIGAASLFFKASTYMFIGMIQDLEGVGNAIKDVDKMLATVTILGKLTKIIGDMADMGLKAAKMAIVASLFGGTDAASMMNSMSGFVTSIIGSLTSLVKELVVMAQAMGSPEALKGAEALANIIAAVAQLASALIDPMTNLKSEAGFFSDGPSQVQLMAQIGTTIGGILNSLSIHLPGIVKALIGSLKGMGKPEVIKKQADALKSIFEGLFALIQSVQQISEMSQKGQGDGGFFSEETTKFDPTVMTGLFENVTKVLEDDHLKKLIRTAEKLGNQITDPEAAKKKADALKSVVSGTIDMIKQVAELGKFLGAGKGVLHLTSLKASMELMDKAKVWPSQLLTKITSEAADIAKTIGNLEADIGEVHLKPLMDGVLGYEGDQKFTIEAKGVNLGVSMSIVIDSEKLAESIVKGTVDKGGFFETTEAAAKGILEGDRQMKKWYDSRG